MIHVPDVRAAVDWYAGLGFKVVATYGDETGDELSFGMVSFGETEVMFNEGGAPSTKHRREVDLYVYTDDVDELYKRLKDRVDVVEPPHDTIYGARELIIRDLNRFWITFGQDSVFAMLMSGAREGNVELVQKVIGGGGLKTETLNLALAVASAHDHSDIVQLLRETGATPPPTIDIETFQSYVGSYKGDQGFSAEITLKDGRLYATPAGQQPMSLWPLDHKTFKLIALENATIVFNFEHGRTIGLTLVQDEHRMRLKLLS